MNLLMYGADACLDCLAVYNHLVSDAPSVVLHIDETPLFSGTDAQAAFSQASSILRNLRSRRFPIRFHFCQSS